MEDYLNERDATSRIGWLLQGGPLTIWGTDWEEKAPWREAGGKTTHKGGQVIMGHVAL